MVDSEIELAGERRNLDLTLTKRADYVVRAAISLARAFPTGELRKIREVAQEMSLPKRYTPQILGFLVKAGLAEARAGQKGGYRLIRDPSDISLLHLLEAADETLRPDRCTLSGGPCHWEDMCPLHPTWEEARRALTDVLKQKSLASVLAVDASLKDETYPVPRDSHRIEARRASQGVSGRRSTAKRATSE